MDTSTKQLIEQWSQKSDSGNATFPESIGALMKLGVESYFADYRKGEKTYYTKEGRAHPVPMTIHAEEIPALFDAAALQAAIRSAQRDEIRYPEFKKRSMAAGCIGYIVWIDGRHVSYFGHRGEVHIEKFPDNK